jgi:hypothetical protein
MRAEFQGGYLPCDSGGLSPEVVRGLQKLLPATPALRSGALMQMATRPNKACVIDMEAVLDYFGISMAPASYLSILVLYLWVMHVITYAALLFLARKERR